ncbi:MAG: ABC transporter ATP-binding protein [Anaerolineales bacterium]|nr:ABC transporter ATP-binding protein [Anaerolineales bacterium]
MQVVRMQGIKKQFGPVTANDSIDFDLQQGEVHALLGENGAGKTTLMRILYGLYKQDAGDIFLNDQLVQINSPKDAIRYGIGMVTQHFALVPPMTIAENVVLGYTDGFRVDQTTIEKKVSKVASRCGFEMDPNVLVRHLSVGQRQRVEIIKALYREAKVLILDEPTAVLVPQEVDSLFETLRNLCSDGMSVIFISHKLHEVTSITNRVTVMRDGKHIGTVNTADVTQNELAQMMVGQKAFGVKRLTTLKTGCEILKIKNLSAQDDKGLPAIKRINLNLCTNEILGIAGVGGNGQKELAETLCGVRQPVGGSIHLDGKELVGKTPEEFTQSGMGRVPEDRHEGMVGELTVAENLALEYLQEFKKYGSLDKGLMEANAARLIEQFKIKARPQDKTRTLSGGNMQKVLLARVLSREPKVVIVPQPTRGLDVGATDYVREQLLEQKRRGAGVLLISEDLDEILALSDRIAVIYEGEIVGVLKAREATPERLGLLMSGAVKEVA